MPMSACHPWLTFHPNGVEKAATGAKVAVPPGYHLSHLRRFAVRLVQNRSIAPSLQPAWIDGSTLGRESGKPTLFPFGLDDEVGPTQKGVRLEPTA